MWRLPDEYQIVVNHGLGSHVWDMTGREYIDCILGSGPVIVGHAHPAVVAAVQAQVAQGATYFLLNEPAIRLAEMVVDAVPCAEQIRFVSTGTEATFYAIRIARAFTGRNKVLKFEGALHGGNDYATMSTTPPHTSDYPHGIPDSSGIPPQVQEQVLVSEFNNLALTRELVLRHGDDLGGDYHGAAAARAQSGSGLSRPRCATWPTRSGRCLSSMRSSPASVWRGEALRSTTAWSRTWRCWAKRWAAATRWARWRAPPRSWK